MCSNTELGTHDGSTTCSLLVYWDMAWHPLLIMVPEEEYLPLAPQIHSYLETKRNSFLSCFTMSLGVIQNWGICDLTFLFFPCHFQGLRLTWHRKIPTNTTTQIVTSINNRLLFTGLDRWIEGRSSMSTLLTPQIPPNGQNAQKLGLAIVEQTLVSSALDSNINLRNKSVNSHSAPLNPETDVLSHTSVSPC